MPLPSRWLLSKRSADKVFRVLVVCTGNICRSPLGEQLLRARIPAAFGRTSIAALEVTSAGTQALEHAPMDRYSVDEAVRLDVQNAGEHQARQVRRRLLRSADLVLTMERRHRAYVERLAPSAIDQVFTLGEFSVVIEALAREDARIVPLGDDGFASFMRQVVAAANGARSFASHGVDGGLDIEDPYRRPAEVYRRSADSINTHVTGIASSVVRLAKPLLAGCAT